MDAADTIAKGGQPAWEATFEHPEHGKLKFRVPNMPRTKDWLRHAVVQEQIAPGLMNAGYSSALAAAVAGMMTFMECPVLSETRVEDPDDPNHVTLEVVRYDPLEDESMDFPVQVWTAWWVWRAQLLARREQVKNSSGATGTPASGGVSPGSTTSLSTTLA